MPGPLGHDPQPPTASERKDLDDIIDRLGVGDELGTLVDGEVPRHTGAIPARVLPGEDASGHAIAEATQVLDVHFVPRPLGCVDGSLDPVIRGKHQALLLDAHGHSQDGLAACPVMSRRRRGHRAGGSPPLPLWTNRIMTSCGPLGSGISGPRCIRCRPVGRAGGHCREACRPSRPNQPARPFVVHAGSPRRASAPPRGREVSPTTHR